MSRPGKARTALIGEMMAAMREVSGLSVLYSDAMARRLGINGTDLECLDMIMRAGEMSPTVLAQRAGITTGAITGVIDRLERAGFAVRASAAEDRRRLVVRPVSAAAGQVMALGQPMADAVASRLASYDDTSLRLLLDMVGKASEAAREAIEILAKGS